MKKRYFFQKSHSKERKLSGLDIIEIENVTVLFSDIDGFYNISLHTSPEDLLRRLNTFFLCFDDAAERFGLQKLKTIGDAYMCAGGLQHPFHPAQAVLAALQAHTSCRQRLSEEWSFRIGIHTGNVYAGRLGRLPSAFDIWGTTVNLASRMESSAPKGGIQVSDSVWKQVETWFDGECLGDLPSQLGNGQSYIIKGIRNGLSEEDILQSVQNSENQ